MVSTRSLSKSSVARSTDGAGPAKGCGSQDSGYSIPIMTSRFDVGGSHLKPEVHQGGGDEAFRLDRPGRCTVQRAGVDEGTNCGRSGITQIRSRADAHSSTALSLVLIMPI